MENENTLTEEEIEKTFAAINKAKYEMSMEQLISNRFPEMIAFELSLYSKAYMYDYNAVHYGIQSDMLINQTFFDKFASKASDYLKITKTNADELGYTVISLKDKCLLCQAHQPSKFCDKEYVIDGKVNKELGIKSYKLDFTNRNRDYYYSYWINMNIVYATSGGNHRLLLQALQNNDIEAKVHEYEDIELLQNFNTDGGYLINKYDPDIKILMPNYRLAVIFRLTQLKLGLN